MNQDRMIEGTPELLARSERERRREPRERMADMERKLAEAVADKEAATRMASRSDKVNYELENSVADMELRLQRIAELVEHPPTTGNIVKTFLEVYRLAKGE
jgi:hypothetical protein